MRKSHSVRNYSRSSSTIIPVDDLGILREDESAEDALRRQLLEKDRENDRLHSQIDMLQAQLSQRPPLENILELEKEYKSLEILLQGTQRENERCMADMERGKNREKLLERELEKLAGSNWQTSLEIASPINPTSRAGFNTTFNSSPAPSTGAPSAEASQATLAHIEQVRLLILGMEQRLQVREEKLEKTVEVAQAEGARLEALRKGALGAA
ncbi:hypothetical protein FIBSPDRAFT_851638 [Athelia psychrophila]|uniref:Uncharacterized protein n=1 Tax=Athelia psychrophila TaxID=1759441 RepID=A0A166SBX9_9AGAM|nr:hypothetical protein FIBSPDRAFT_851638 [Fibularhizoctonia sp. CBS 109695]